MKHQHPASVKAFTLLELSLVVLILGLLGAAVLRYAGTQADANNIAMANANLDVVETALMNYRVMYGRLPCPADITSSELVDNDYISLNPVTYYNIGIFILDGFGVEVGIPGDGYCGTPGGTGTSNAASYGGYNYVVPNFYNNTTPDPDTNNTGSDPWAAAGKETLYDSTTVSQVVAGAIPTAALRLPDKYAYDPWGRKILYAVDKRITANQAFSTYPVANTTIGAIVIKNMTTDSTGCAPGTVNPASKSCLQLAVTTKALYALVSFGEDGHGGYVRNTAGTSTAYNAGATNADELANCHCNSSAVATSFYRIFVQKPKTPSATPGAGFDDIVRFKTRQEMASPAELQ